MGFSKLSSIFILLSLSSLFISPAIAAKKSYVVLLGSHSHGPHVTEADHQRVVDSHHYFLRSFLGSAEKVKDAIFYSYKNHINGFAAVLEEERAAEIAQHPEVAAVLLDKARQLHTTHSWDFMNQEKHGAIYSRSLWKKAKFGQDTIIGNLDTGVWPESMSFRESGIRGPVPRRWKGGCENNTAEGVRCNRKLIGAKYFNEAYLQYLRSQPSFDFSTMVNSTRDIDGHGTHTLSTAGGAFVPAKNVFGPGYGSAKGGSPKARLAAYKVCWPVIGCFDADIMEAIDEAMHDGVDVLNLSIGGDPDHYYEDGIAIGSFHAVKNGISVVCSAGNDGPSPGSVSNTAPWIITVGASTEDREFQGVVELNNGRHFTGASLSKAMPDDKVYPMITGAQARFRNGDSQEALLCKPGTLDPSKVKGKILACLRGDNTRADKGNQAVLAGAVGMILCNSEKEGSETIADMHVLPATHLNFQDGEAVISYITYGDNPMGKLLPPKQKVNTQPAPVMAAFSSRGPNVVTAEIIKPDITAPGVNIIAAYTQANKGTTPYVTLSGTSMSSPHIAGIVGLLKTLHPDWSPAAIKSAIMTSARVRDNRMLPITDSGDRLQGQANPFSFGSGHVQPNGAIDPGLVYDLTTKDYLNFLCAIGYDEKNIRVFSDGPYECPASASLLNFNYPSIAVMNLDGNVTVTRKLKNVGSPGVYKAKVRVPEGIKVSVKPSVLKFNHIGEEKSFKMTLSGTAQNFVDGTLIWTDGKHFVRSPIVVFSG